MAQTPPPASPPPAAPPTPPPPQPRPPAGPDTGRPPAGPKTSDFATYYALVAVSRVADLTRSLCRIAYAAGCLTVTVASEIRQERRNRAHYNGRRV